MLDATDGLAITTPDDLANQAQAPAENTTITMRVDDVVALVKSRVFDTISHLQISPKIREGIKTTIRDTVLGLIGQKDSYKLFSDTNDLNAFMDSVVAKVAEAIAHESIAKLHASFRRLEVANTLRGEAIKTPIESLSTYELTLLAIKAYRTGQFQLEAQFREEILRKPNLPVNDIVLNLTHLISSYERLQDIEYAIALSEILLEYLETKITDEQVTLKSDRKTMIVRTQSRIARLKNELAVCQT